MVVAFLWGCFAATFTVGGANDAISSLYAKALGQSWQLDWDAALSAPFTEEPAKGFGMLLLIALAPRLVRTAFDGFILGAFIGLGFQIIEDIVVYAMSSAGPQFVATVVLRMFTPPRTSCGAQSSARSGLIFSAGPPNPVASGGVCYGWRHRYCSTGSGTR